MKKDYVYSIFVVLIIIGLILAVLSSPFLAFAKEQPLIASFLKFFFLASMGDFIAMRFKAKEWKIPTMFFAKAFIWGVIGIFIYWMFQVFSLGVVALQEQRALPALGNNIITAILISVLMNIVFAPTMMTVHRISDTWLNHYKEKLAFNEIINMVNWGDFVTFTFLRTIPFFWIPAHTITFLIPSEYRIIFAAVLGIILGLFLGLYGYKKKV